MLETKVLCKNPLIIHHKVLSLSNAQATADGVKDAVEVINEALSSTDTYELLMDFSQLNETSQYNITAHKEWSIGFKDNLEITKYIQRIAVYGNDSPNFRAEKEHMEDEFHKWFTDFNEAVSWLKTVFNVS